MTEEKIRTYPSEFSQQEWQRAKEGIEIGLNKLERLTHAQENADFIFPEGTRIRPQNIRTRHYRGWRTLRETVFADHVFDKKGKPLKIENLSVWQTFNGVEIWDGRDKRTYSLSEGDKFLAYTKNAQKNRGKKKK